MAPCNLGECIYGGVLLGMLAIEAEKRGLHHLEYGFAGLFQYTHIGTTSDFQMLALLTCMTHNPKPENLFT